MIERNVTLRLDDGVYPVHIRVSQFDTMWRFVFTIVYNSQPWIIPRSGGSLTTTAVLNGRKPDGNVFAFAGTINGDNTVTVDCDVQMTAVAGQTVCELSILSDGKVVGTANFVLDVEAAPQDLIIVPRNTTKYIGVRLPNNAQEISSAEFLVKENYESTGVVFEKTIENDGVILESVTDFYIEIDSTDTELVQSGIYFGILYVVAGGNKYELYKGPVYIV